MPEIDSSKILACRKAVDDYRAAHAELHAAHPEGGVSAMHTPLLEKMLSELKALGFNSVDEFMEFNKEANLEEENGTFVFEGECNFCEGRERTCDPVCYERQSKPDPSTPTGRTKMTPDKTQTLKSRSRWKEFHNVRMEIGEVMPSLPNCSILVRCIRKRRFDIDWR